MKALDIALKDLISSFRSAFSVVFMFVVPLLVTGMFYFMLGNLGGETGFHVPITQVVVANLDQPVPAFAALSGSFPGTVEDAASLGEVISAVLQSDEFEGLLEVTLAADAAAARQAVDGQHAGVAIIIPSDLSARFTEGQGQVELELYADPTLSLGPGIVRSVLQGFMDGISSGKITIDLAVNASPALAEPEKAAELVAAFLAARPQGNPAARLLAVQNTAGQPEPPSVLAGVLTSIMGGMLVFYAFFTGASVAQSILHEDERRTLSRLFTTPTSPTTILGGKYLSVLLTVSVQVITLLVLSSLIFRIQWGDLARLSMFVAGCIAAAASFGVFLNSLLKSTKQGGVIFGGVITFTGMLGMIPIFTGGVPGGVGWINVASLLVPQGWAVRALNLSVSEGNAGQVVVTTAVLLAWSAAFFFLGARRFQKRFL